MTQSIARRGFLAASAGLLVPSATVGGNSGEQKTMKKQDQTSKEQLAKPAPPKDDRLASSLVHEFVKVAHKDLPRVKQLLKSEPYLIRATWDWGEGDFETALGAAAHMGREDIANFLLEQGSPIDLFAAAMLGKLEIVKASLTAFPRLIDVEGPHGIPLINHAIRGGDEAQSVVKFLKSRAATRSREKEGSSKQKEGK